MGWQQCANRWQILSDRVSNLVNVGTWICDWKRGMRDEEDTDENNLHDYKFLNECMPQ